MDYLIFDYYIMHPPSNQFRLEVMQDINQIRNADMQTQLDWLLDSMLIHTIDLDKKSPLYSLEENQYALYFYQEEFKKRINRLLR